MSAYLCVKNTIKSHDIFISLKSQNTLTSVIVYLPLFPFFLKFATLRLLLPPPPFYKNFKYEKSKEQILYPFCKKSNNKNKKISEELDSQHFPSYNGITSDS